MPAWFWEGVLVLLAASEIPGLSEWLARRLVRWSAHLRYANSPYARDMAEELERVVIDRPVQMLKLLTAVCFAFAVIRAWLARCAAQQAVSSVRLVAAASAGTVTLVSALTAGTALTLYSVLTVSTVVTLPDVQLPSSQPAPAASLPAPQPSYVLDVPVISVPTYANYADIVQPGDTLSSIACHWDTTVAAIQRLNHLGNSTLIWPGELLWIPFTGPKGNC